MAFEENLRRLETIVAQLDSDSLSLEEALALFEDGIAALREASKALMTAEARVKVLVQEADGAIVTRSLDGE